MTHSLDRRHQTQQLAAAAARRRQIFDWQKRHEGMRARNDEERIAQWEALCSLEQARRDRLGPEVC